MIHNIELLRHLKGGERCFTTHLHVHRVKRLATDNISNRHFAPNRMSRSDHCCFRNLRLPLKELLDLPRIDVISAGDDEVTRAASQFVVSVSAVYPEVARAKVAIRKSILR